jgi:hypothetical protein
VGYKLAPLKAKLIRVNAPTLPPLSVPLVRPKNSSPGTPSTWPLEPGTPELYQSTGSIACCSLNLSLYLSLYHVTIFLFYFYFILEILENLNIPKRLNDYDKPTTSATCQGSDELNLSVGIQKACNHSTCSKFKNKKSYICNFNQQYDNCNFS